MGTTRAQLTANSIRTYKGVLIRSPGSADPTPNTGVIWIGGAAVTADSNSGTGGMPLTPGDSVFIPIDDPSKLYVISDTAAQDVAWLLL